MEVQSSLPTFSAYVAISEHLDDPVILVLAALSGGGIVASLVLLACASAAGRRWSMAHGHRAGFDLSAILQGIWSDHASRDADRFRRTCWWYVAALAIGFGAAILMNIIAGT